MLYIGTSGWQYRDWREPVYHGQPQRAWLSLYAERFATVEVNSAFYRLPARDTFTEWARHTPDDFVLAVKMSRYLTHIKRLRDPAEPIARFFERAAGLGAKLGPVLLQLPPNLTVAADALDETLRRFPAGVLVAVEPRHRSWWTGEVRSTLERRGAALCWSDRGGRPVAPLWRTAEFAYLRLHFGRARPAPRYGRAALRSWVDRLGGDCEAYAYFNNDSGAAAPADATALGALARARGFAVSRT